MRVLKKGGPSQSNSPEAAGNRVKTDYVSRSIIAERMEWSVYLWGLRTAAECVRCRESPSGRDAPAGR